MLQAWNAIGESIIVYTNGATYNCPVHTICFRFCNDGLRLTLAYHGQLLCECSALM